MASGLIIIPNYMPALNGNGVPYAGAKMYFYENDSTVPKAVYQDANLTVPHAQPVVSNNAGVFPAIYADTTAYYNVAVTTGADVPLSPVYEGVSATTTVIEAIASTDYTTVAQAAAANIDAAVHRIRTQYYAPNYAIPITMTGGAEYRPADLADLTDYPTSSYFQSADGRYWVLDDKDSINPDALGAYRDDTTDCTTAFNDACTLANLTNLPVRPRAGGTYYGVGPFNTLEMGQSVIGEKGCRIRSPNGFVTVDPVNTTSPQMWAVSVFRDLWFIPTGVGTSAINVDSTFSNSVSPGRITGAYVEDCKFAVADESLIYGFRSSRYDYWADAIHLTAVALGRISNCFITGGFEITPGGYLSGRETTTGLRVDGNTIRLDVDKGTNIQCCGYGIYIGGTTEGFDIDANEIIYCRQGIHIETSTQGGATRVRSGHINCSERGIYIKNRKVFNISDENIWYNSAYEVIAGWTAIELDTCVDFTIHGCATQPSVVAGQGTTNTLKLTNCQRGTITDITARYTTNGINLSNCQYITLDNIGGDNNTIGLLADATCDYLYIGAVRFPTAASTPISVSSSATNVFYSAIPGRPDGSATTINAAGSETVTAAQGYIRRNLNAQSSPNDTTCYAYEFDMSATGARPGSIVMFNLRIGTPYCMVTIVDNVGAVQQRIVPNGVTGTFIAVMQYNGGTWRMVSCNESSYSVTVLSTAQWLAPGEEIRQVATCSAIPTLYNSSYKYVESVSQHHARDNIKFVSLGFAGWYVDSTTLLETNIGVDNTIAASIEYPAGVFTQIKFSGSTPGTLTAGTTLFSDFAQVYIPQGAIFWVRCHIVSAGGIAIMSLGGNGYSGSPAAYQYDRLEKSTSSALTDRTMGGTVTAAASQGECYRPCAIVAATKKPALLLWGDSIVAGATDFPDDKSGDCGSLARALGPAYAYINVSRGGDRAQIAATSYTKRLALLSYCTASCLALGTNDIVLGTRTDTQLIADLVTLSGLLAATNKPVYGCTITPRTTSTDGWITLANQTVLASPANWETYRQSVNNTIRSGMTSQTAYLDIADAFENERNGGKISVYGAATAKTPDGLHPNNVGDREIARTNVFSPLRFLK